MFEFLCLLQVRLCFTSQGKQMALPGSWQECNHTDYRFSDLQVFEPVFFVIAIPLLYGVIYPLWRMRWVSFRWTPLRRLGLGILLSACASAVAVVIELARMSADSETMVCASRHRSYQVTRSDISLLWQIPQYLLYSLAKCLLVLTSKYYSTRNGDNTEWVLDKPAFWHILLFILRTKLDRNK